MDTEIQDIKYEKDQDDDLIIIDYDDLYSEPEKEYDGSRGWEVCSNLKKAILLKTLFIAVAVGILWGAAVLLFARTTLVLCVLIAALIIIYGIIIFFSVSTLIGYIRDISNAIENVSLGRDANVFLNEKIELIGDQLLILKDEQRKKNEEAREREKKKNDLLMFLAHDLKTPLTSVIAYLTTLDSNTDIAADERKKYTHISLVKAHRLWDLIQEFFEITKFNQQDITLEKEMINLSMMLEQMADEMYGVFQERNMTCRVQTDEGIIINGDPDKLARVFDNLLRNAVNYSYPGTEIKIMAREVGDWIEIVFSNQGKTIPPEDLKIIFEKFYRIDDSRSSVTGGAGLGLAIAKQIVELHDGKITATSEDEKTRFIVVLPEKTDKERKEKAKRLERRIEEAIKDEKIKMPEFR